MHAGIEAIVVGGFAPCLSLPAFAHVEAISAVTDSDVGAEGSLLASGLICKEDFSLY